MTQTRKILQGSASNVVRVLLSIAVALVLPPLLVHRLEPAEYGAWVLILQCSGYIGLLDLGLQTAVGKFVAEYDALEDRRSSGQILSSAFVILCVTALVGAIAICFITWQVPQLFHQMPVRLVGEVRIGILVVGLSSVIALPFGAFMAVFTGLQRYGFPTVLATASKLISSATLAVLLLMKGKLLALIWVLGIANMATALGQFAGWKKYGSDRVEFAWELANRRVTSRLVKYGAVLSIWSVAVLLISGLDVVIVGHYDFRNTGYYGIAASITNAMLLLVSGIFGPLMPAISSLQTGRTRVEIGEITIQATRFCALLLCMVGLPVTFGGYPLLKLWVGHDYAVRSVAFLQVLIFGNAVRQLGYPYSLVVLATGKQHLATIAGIAEATVNICVSLFLIQKIGAIGVAVGTVIGAFVSISLHLTLSMRYTQSAIEMSRRRFVFQGLLRPLLCVVPALLLLPLWSRFALLPGRIPLLIVCCLSTLMIAWRIGLTDADRNRILSTIYRLSRPGYAKAS